MIPWTAEKSIPSSLFDNRTIPANWKGLVYSYTLCFLDHIWYSLEHTGNARTYGVSLEQRISARKKMACWKHREPRTTRGQLVERPCWDVERLYWDVESLYRDMDSGITKKTEIVLSFFWWLFVLTFGGLFVPSFNEQTRGRVRAHKWNSLQKKTRLCRGWFTAYTYGLKGLSAYTGKPWTPIQGLHESLYWENCSPIPGKHPGIASKTPV